MDSRRRSPRVRLPRPARLLALLVHSGGRTGRRCALRGAIFGLLAGSLFLGLWSVGLLSPLENAALDARFLLRYRVAPESAAPSPVTVVAIDDRATAAFGSWPWPRAVQAEVILAILEEKPAALGINLIYSTPSEDFRGDQRLAQSFQSEIPIILAASALGEREQMPLLSLLAPNVHIGHIDSLVESDGVVRRLPWEVDTSMGRLRTLGWEMARRLGNSAVAIPTAQQERALQINLRPSGTGLPLRSSAIAPTVSVVDVIGGHAGELLRDRPVILGLTRSSTSSDERDLTSLRSLGQIPNVYLHAASLTSILRGDYVRHQSTWSLVAVLLVGGIVVGAAGFMLRPWAATGLFAGLVSGTLGYALWRFVETSDWVIVVPPVGLAAVIYVAGLWHAHVEVEREARRVRETFRRYVAPEVVDALLSQPGVAEMGGGRRTVTVLFADIRGFTTLSEHNSPEYMVHLLNRYLELMSESVLLYGGMVDKFLGDGMMAIFGAPLPMANHSEAAMRASLHLLRRIESVAQHEEGLELSVGIGIHSGETVVGSIGSESRLEYTAIGDVVNVASRLQELARSGGIIYSAATHELLPKPLQANGRPLTPVAIRGRSEPVTAYEYAPGTPAHANEVQSATRPIKEGAGS